MTKFLALILLAVPLMANAQIKIESHPGDKGTYYLISNQTIQGRNLVVSKRDGPSGTSFSAREIDCKNMTFRYVAEGETINAMKKNATTYQVGSMSSLVKGSASWFVAKAACK